MPHLSEVQVLRFLIQFTLLFVIARALADAAKHLGQATVIGELLAGIVLGPTILGHFAPGLHAMIFPPDAIADHLLEAVAWIGVIMLLLIHRLRHLPRSSALCDRRAAGAYPPGREARSGADGAE